MRQQLLTLCALALGALAGCFAGHYHGQAETLHLLINDKIECSLTINPITKDLLQ